MLKLVPTTKFKKDLKRFKHQVNLIQDLNNVLALLIERKPLQRKHVNHPLGGSWKDSKECHIHPDILLIYRIDEDHEILFLERFGSHSEIF